MTQRDNILQELRELQSKLADHTPENIYSVPTGYFDGLVEEVLRRIRALEAENAVDELACLSPLLSKLSKKMPYTVPAGYFEGMETSLISSVSTGSQSAKEELETLSPLLSGLKKKMPYSVPAGYFESLGEKRAPNKTKIVSLGSRKWIRFATAAIVTGIIVTIGFLYFSPVENGLGGSFARFEKKITKEIKKTSDKELDDFIQQFSDAGLDTEETVINIPDAEVKELLKDVPETELKKFLEETADTETPDAEEMLLIN